MAQISKRDEILETAGKMFICDGYQCVSMDRLAAAIPVSKPTLYAHFADKRDLFTAVVRERCAIALASMKAGIVPGRPVAENLEAFATQFLTLLLSKEALQFHRMIVGESEKFPDMAEMFFETGPKQTLKVLTTYFKSLEKDGTLRFQDPAYSAAAFISMIKGYTHLSCLLGIEKNVSTKRRQTMIRKAVHIFLHGHAPTTAGK